MKNMFSYKATFLFIFSCISFFQCRKVNDTVIKDILVVNDISPTGGQPGTAVTITGEGFSLILNDDTVLFNGKAGEIIKTTDTSIHVIAPQGGNTGKIKVIVRNKKAEGPVFTYLKADQPQITSISPKTGWDYTLNSVTITGKNFGKDRNKVTVTFDGKTASLQSFSPTKLIVSPPKHAQGKVKVVVKVGDIVSNAVDYIYQLKPEIFNIFVHGWDPGDSRYYFISVKNLTHEDLKNTLTINGKEVKVDSVFRQGSAEYDLNPAGEKIITSYYVPKSVGYVSIMDFTITANGIKSESYRYINEPDIIDFISNDYERIINPGDTVTIGGIYLGTLKKGSVVELWDSLENTHYAPDPKILSWDDYKVKIIIPATYPIPPGARHLRLKLKENGKEAKVYMRFLVPCPKLNEVYTGQYQYPNQDGQPYGIQLFPDGTMDFSSSYDDYAGTYTYDCTTKEVKMDFAGHGVIVKAIRESNALTHFTFIKSSGFSFLNGKLNTTWNQNLDNTTWQLANPLGTSTFITFKAENKVSLDQGQQESTYTRKAGTIRFTIDRIHYFATIDGNTMEGVWPNGIWQATKQ